MSFVNNMTFIHDTYYTQYLCILIRMCSSLYDRRVIGTHSSVYIIGTHSGMYVIGTHRGVYVIATHSSVHIIVYLMYTH